MQRDTADGTETPSGADDRLLVAALRAGDEQAFATLVERYYGAMLRVARDFVSSQEAAEDVVQDTFLGVIEGIDRFEERSSLRTWLFRILVNRAKTRGVRDSRIHSFSTLAEASVEAHSVDPDRFVAEGRWVGFWEAPPAPLPEERLLGAEAAIRMLSAIDGLPPSQRLVITLRDVDGLGPEEVCDLLDISEGNQRVLLHRARSRVRAELESYFRPEVSA